MSSDEELVSAVSGYFEPVIQSKKHSSDCSQWFRYFRQKIPNDILSSCDVTKLNWKKNLYSTDRTFRIQDRIAQQISDKSVCAFCGGRWG